MNRRSFFKSLFAAAVAAQAIDIEELLWVPKSMITVPAMPQHLSRGELVARAWEEYVKGWPADNVFNDLWLLQSLKEGHTVGSRIKVEFARNNRG